MFSKLFAFFVLFAVAFAAPKPAPAPAPAPQLLTYSAGVDYVYPAAAAVPSAVVSTYAAAPLAYSPYAAYSAFPGAVYVK